ncbi:MAG: Kef-type K+ transport system membrane component KefB [Paraglaciecola sp.]
MIDSLTQLAVIWGAVFIAVAAARFSRLTPVLFFLLVGMVMVNSGILPEQGDPFIRGFAELGIIIIMFALGFEENTSNFLLSIKRSWGIALFGAIAPFLSAFWVANYFWQDTNLALMCGLAMTATAVSLTMVSLKSEGLQNSPVATRIMTSAVLDDIGALVMVAIMVPLASGEQMPGILGITLVIAKMIMFFVLVSALGAWFLPHDAKTWVGRLPLIRHFSARGILGYEKGEYATLTVLLLALVLGLSAHYLGFHPAVGAYMAGLILKEEYFTSSKGIETYVTTKRTVDNAAYAWIGPVFFVQLGTHVIFDWQLFASLIPQTLTLLLAVFIAQIASASLAARYTSGMLWSGSLLIGCGMLGRAELAFVVLDIAYVQHHIIHKEAFYTLMFTAFWLNVTLPITIHLLKPYYQLPCAATPKP